MGSWFHKAGAASEKALLAVDQGDLDETLGWARRVAYQVQNEVQDEIENMVTDNKISSPCMSIQALQLQLNWQNFLCFDSQSNILFYIMKLPSLSLVLLCKEIQNTKIHDIVMPRNSSLILRNDLMGGDNLI